MLRRQRAVDRRRPQALARGRAGRPHRPAPGARPRDPPRPAARPVDFAFVDADKGGYIDYYEAIVPRLRPGGLLVADNVLWSGRVVGPSVTDDDTEAIRRFNDHVAADDRCDRVMLRWATASPSVALAGGWKR